ncbi:GTP-binding protein Rhes-like [Daphnia carinata]|uniref:GTP-binding protein Rhes-like n=1 Tax=Daphnia carinata TaxID=120202 RepID=UPI00257C2A7F|nr:GTP-binding protein Rhes-like [Daphnia carinata]XP_057375927.1 GTP-binding protein Rhes-like [Daphnia carinata]
MAESVIETAECNTNVAPVEDLLQTASHQNCQRLVVLGSARSGKSSLVARFLSNKFSDSYTPTIENFYRKVYRIRGEVYQLDILDTSGNHPFPAMQRLSFITGDLFLLVYSVDSRESFEEVARLRSQIIETKSHIGGRRPVTQQSFRGSKKTSTPSLVPMIIAGNKCDREMRTVTVEELAMLCSGFAGCGFVETSAKKNWNIDELFRQLFQLADLPAEMAPNSHRRLLPAQLLGSSSSVPLPPMLTSSPTAQTKKKGSRRFQGLSIRRRMSDAYGVVALNVRRPSLHTDLMIMKKKTSQRQPNSASSNAPSTRARSFRCVIQ